MNNGEKLQYKLPEVRVKLMEGSALYSSNPINTPQNAVYCMAGMLAGLDREYLCVVNLDTKGHPINYNIVSIGGINSTVVDMANVFKTAILSNASRIMLLHNHPSGNIRPSQLDIAVTKKVYAVSRLMDIELIDHIIVGGISGKYCSMLEEGYFSAISQMDFAAEFGIGEPGVSPKIQREGSVAIPEKTAEKKRQHHRAR